MVILTHVPGDMPASLTDELARNTLPDLDSSRALVDWDGFPVAVAQGSNEKRATVLQLRRCPLGLLRIHAIGRDLQEMRTLVDEHVRCRVDEPAGPPG